jgi:hypothetical protein
MTVIDKPACSPGRRDEVTNKELATKSQIEKQAGGQGVSGEPCQQGLLLVAARKCFK